MGKRRGKRHEGAKVPLRKLGTKAGAERGKNYLRGGEDEKPTSDLAKKARTNQGGKRGETGAIGGRRDARGGSAGREEIEGKAMLGGFQGGEGRTEEEGRDVG